MTLDDERIPEAGIEGSDGPRRAPWVRVIIVNYNSGGMLQCAVDSLAVQTMHAFEAFVVDNASADTSIGDLKLPDGRFRVVHLDKNVGFAAANNVGASGASTPWIATLNPDAFARPDWLEELQAATERYPDVAMFASVQLDASNESRLDGCGDAMSIYGIPWRGGFGAPVSSAPGNDFDTFAPCAAAALYRRDMFNLVGGFDERFFCYLEDVDLAFRIRLQGERCVVARKAIVSHVGSAVAGRKSDFTLFHSYRNRIWLVMKNTPGPLLLVVLPLQLLTNLALLCALLVRGRVVPAVRGLFASLSGLNGVFASRKQVQSGRCVRVTALARALAWSPSRVAGRRIHVLRPERTANPSARRQLMPPHGSTR